MDKLQHSIVDRDGFRPRGTEPSRIDAFSDVVFGFALTLLVVSLEVPKTFDELLIMLHGFFPFALCFLLLTLVWIQHYRFFRRFGLHDMATIWVNALLLFVVLFYVYPLKFLFTVALTKTNGAAFSSPMQNRHMMVLYGVGFAAVYGLLALLNYQAWRQRRELGLSRLEEILTLSYILEVGAAAAVGLLSCVVAWLLPPKQAGWAGMTYFLIALYYRAFHLRWRNRKIKALGRASHSPEAAE
jgi:uncharacterized membrane protein